MTTIGIIGSGNIGSTVARLAIGVGDDVVLSNSRGPATLTDLVGDLGPRARAGTREDAVSASELVLVSIPIRAYPTLSGVSFAGKIVMDTGNYYPARDGEIRELAERATTDSEYLAGFLPGASVVKVFNNIYFAHLLNLARPTGADDRSALPIAGDDESSKQRVVEFLDAIGYSAVDVGSLADGWRQQPGTPVYGAPYGAFDDEAGTPADERVIRSAVAEAARAS